jgi:hypothetical protein
MVFRRRAAAVALALSCGCAGGTALAAVVGPVPPAAAANPAIATTTTTTGATTSTSTTTTTAAPMLEVCLPSVRRRIAGRLGVRAASIADHEFLATNGMPQCNFVIARAHRGGPAGKVVVTANIDNGPQAHWRLMRKVVEATQIFGPTPKGFRPPFQIRGLGAYASWFPALDQMMANNLGGGYLITVGAIWHHSTQAEKIALTRAVTLIYRHLRRMPA